MKFVAYSIRAEDITQISRNSKSQQIILTKANNPDPFHAKTIFQHELSPHNDRKSYVSTLQGDFR